MLAAMRKHGITLALFAGITTGLTALVYQLTKTTIAHQTALQRQALLNQVLPAEYYDNDLLASCFIVRDERLGSRGDHRLYLARRQGVPVAAVVEAIAPDGYSGAIHLLVASDFQATVLGTRVIEHRETPGLGDKIELRHSYWITQFSGQHVDSPSDPRWAVKKEGGMFDQFTGATITPRAVINAVRRSTLLIQELPGQLTTLPTCGAR
ncbi:electron transport complex subunit RsxG [Serratia microhaemolytica]|uniref:electron transport complex subunit RsxG n=1 Tax=Serratia microhaemolytica TaxID=2675110 RepID=UPI000FDDA608|nr:electron transport complex subunit RsxG [Serratia microhaemolytica]